MPGSVQNAVPVTVMPASLSTAFLHSREFAIRENEYKHGESQRDKLANSSRKYWDTAKRLAPALIQELRDFYNARNGTHEPFYFYDPWDTDPLFSHDPTGAAMQGRYTVRFDGEWNHATTFRRSNVRIRLVELA